MQASMGPRSADRGNEHGSGSNAGTGSVLQWGRDQLIAEMRSRSARDVAADRHASMGPRSADRGNACAVGSAARGQPCASMGPRSADRGNCTDRLCMASHWHVLQWGRDQLIAEIATARDRSHARRIALQWGRDQLIAEMQLHADTACAIQRSLQWGRDQLIAEMRSTRAGDATRDVGFNGAAIS